MADPESQSGVALTPQALERRLTSRFRMQHQLQYRVLHSRGASGWRIGKTLDVSSRGIRFTTSERIPIGRTVEIAMHWPARLNGTCPLQLVAAGQVIRSDNETAAVRIRHYEFRTRSATANVA